LRWLVRSRDRQTRDEVVHERADGHGEQQGADADGPAEQPADGQHRQLDRGAHDADRVTARGQAGHQPVPRARPEAGTDVQAGGDAVDHDARRQQGRPLPDAVHGGHGVERGVGR
jgi:hypothetical protein